MVRVTFRKQVTVKSPPRRTLTRIVKINIPTPQTTLPEPKELPVVPQFREVEPLRRTVRQQGSTITRQFGLRTKGDIKESRLGRRVNPFGQFVGRIRS